MKRISVRSVLPVFALLAFFALTAVQIVSGQTSSHSQIVAADDPKGGTSS